MKTPAVVVGYSADFLNASAQPVFPLGMDALRNQPGLEHRFFDEYLPEYASRQLANLDVPISLKPRVQWIRRGFRMISPGSDIGVYVNAFQKFREMAVCGSSSV